MTRTERLSTIALLAVPFAALACSPRLTMEQFECPKHFGVLLLSGTLLAAGAAAGWRRHPVLLAWLAAVAASALASPDRVAAFLGGYENLEGALTWFAYGVLFLAGSRLGDARAGRFRSAVLLAALLAAAYALLQQAGLDPFRGERFRHVRSFAGNPDFLAQQMAMALPLTLAPGGYPGLAAGGALALVLALSASRGGLLGGIAGCAVLWTLLRRTPREPHGAGAGNPGVKRAVAVLAAALCAAEVLLPPDLSLHGRFESLVAGRGLARTRGLMWEGAARAARERPLLGWGPDGLGGVFLRYAPPGWADLEGLGTTARKAHDEPLHLLSTLGAAGLGAWLWLLASAWRGRLRDPAAAAAVAAALAHNLVGFSTAATAPVVWVLLGRLAGAAAPPAAPRGSAPGLAAGLGALMAVFGAVRLAADAWGYVGNEASRAGAPVRAAPAFLVAARLAPWEPTYFARAGIALEQAVRTADALPVFERAAALSPLDGIRLGHVGRAAFAVSPPGSAERERAYADLLRAVDLAPSEPSLYGAAIMAAQGMARRGDVDRLVSAFRARSPVWAARMLGTGR